jgi:hypothetical protein
MIKMSFFVDSISPRRVCAWVNFVLCKAGGAARDFIHNLLMGCHLSCPTAQILRRQN